MRVAISITALLISICFIQFADAEELIELKVRGGISHKALFYEGSSSKAAVLAHQSGETMESWRKFANILADRGVASISLSSLTPDDVSAKMSLRSNGIPWVQNYGHHGRKEGFYAIHNCGCSASTLAVGNGFVLHHRWIYPHPARHCRCRCSVTYHQRQEAVLTLL